MTSPPAPLPQRTLGRSGITVPAVGMGCWGIGGPDENLGLPMGWSTGASAEASAAGLEVAWQMGARLFDTADVYGHGRSERQIGALVARVPREEIVLVSKVGYFAGTALHGFDPRHMRRQLEQSLDNLRTDHLDIYFLHHSDFGDGDRWLEPAAEAMQTFRREGLIRAVGMRGPHRFALDRLTASPDQRGDKIARFRAVFAAVEPDVLAVRDHLLSPADRSEGIFAFAAEHEVGVLINKPLAQGLLTGAYDPAAPPQFGKGDHRSRKRWFTPAAIALIAEGLDELQGVVGSRREDLIHIALWACLDRYAHAAVLVGFTTPEQVAMNLSALGDRPPSEVIRQARVVMGRLQERLDAQGEVFTDEIQR
ncbi:aldo/keto reductase [Herbidospora yilanensis]|uniref:aldo/keto reductase n=1 Tax=Herbidospora yilanensis TaxID=354426 RepID=UPI000780CB71|nr:aldo/keto reductase [Herbidospora yilanensis]